MGSTKEFHAVNFKLFKNQLKAINERFIILSLYNFNLKYM